MGRFKAVVVSFAARRPRTRAQGKLWALCAASAAQRSRLGRAAALTSGVCECRVRWQNLRPSDMSHSDSVGL